MEGKQPNKQPRQITQTKRETNKKTIQTKNKQYKQTTTRKTTQNKITLQKHGHPQAKKDKQ